MVQVYPVNYDIIGKKKHTREGAVRYTYPKHGSSSVHLNAVNFDFAEIYGSDYY